MLEDAEQVAKLTMDGHDLRSSAGEKIGQQGITLEELRGLEPTIKVAQQTECKAPLE